MATLILTEAPQKIVGGSNGVMIDSRTPFMYGFGDTAPTDGANFVDCNNQLNYLGGFGDIWVWKNTNFTSQPIYYVVAV